MSALSDRRDCIQSAFGCAEGAASHIPRPVDCPGAPAGPGEHPSEARGPRREEVGGRDRPAHALRRWSSADTARPINIRVAKTSCTRAVDGSDLSIGLGSCVAGVPHRLERWTGSGCHVVIASTAAELACSAARWRGAGAPVAEKASSEATLWLTALGRGVYCALQRRNKSELGPLRTASATVARHLHCVEAGARGVAV